MIAQRWRRGLKDVGDQALMRGLATAGRLFGRNGAAALGSGVAIGSNFGTCCCP